MSHYPHDPSFYLEESLPGLTYEHMDSEVQAPSSSSTHPTARQKKKSKMHECPICLKSFPRPSGLKTHMNTHTNEKPFPCSVPGCTRSFAVRSNAKRHLRTHGIIPSPAHQSKEQPYIVDFSEPVVMPPVPLDTEGSLPQINKFADADAEVLLGVDLDTLAGGEHTHTPAGENSGRIDNYPPATTAPFKLRWMPPSATSRRNGAVRLGETVPASPSASASPLSNYALPLMFGDIDIDIDMDAGVDME